MQGNVKIHGKSYTEVKDRIAHLYEKDRTFPNSYIVTEMASHAPDMSWVVFKATLFCNESESDERSFTGWAFEERLADKTEVNFSSWVENCETSAIGRALANANIGVSEDGARPSKQEMDKVERWKSEKPSEKPTPTSPLGGKGAIKKIQALKPDYTTKESMVEALFLMKEECKKVFGHDQPFQQMLVNNKLTEATLKDSTQETLKAMQGGFGPFLLSIEDMKKSGMDWTRAAKEMSLLL